MKMAVHFRVIDDHSNGCEFSNLKSSHSTSNSKQENRPFKKKTIDNFHLERPKDYYNRKNTIATHTDKVRIKKEFKKHNKPDQPKNYYAIRSIVSRFYNLLSSNEDLSKYYLNIKGHNIPYSEFFCPIDQQNLSSLSKYHRIYYQKAFLNSLRNGAIQVKFASPFIVEDRWILPSIYCDLDVLKNSKKAYLIDKLKSYVDSKRPDNMVYIYGKPQLKTDKKERKFLNFSLSNYDFLDIR